MSYVPWLWHPMIRVETSGDVTWLKPGTLIERGEFAKQVVAIEAKGGAAPTGHRANPIYLPAPHAVAPECMMVPSVAV